MDFDYLVLFVHHHHLAAPLVWKQFDYIKNLYFEWSLRGRSVDVLVVHSENHIIT